MLAAASNAPTITLTDWIIAAVAVYAAIVSTISLVHERRRRRPSIHVEVSTAIPFRGGNADFDNPRIQLTATNNGEHTVTLTSFGIELPDGGKRSIALINAERSEAFPCPLGPGRSCWVMESRRGIMETARIDGGYRGTIKVRGFFSDSANNRYRSRPFRLNLDET